MTSVALNNVYCAVSFPLSNEMIVQFWGALCHIFTQQTRAYNMYIELFAWSFLSKSTGIGLPQRLLRIRKMHLLCLLHTLPHICHMSHYWPLLHRWACSSFNIGASSRLIDQLKSSHFRRCMRWGSGSAELYMSCIGNCEIMPNSPHGLCAQR